MNGRRYTEEFKFEAVKQVTERNYKFSEITKRLGVPNKKSTGLNKEIRSFQSTYKLSD